MFKKELKVAWRTQVFAPRHYPVELVSGESFYFYDENARSGFGFYANANGGWRTTGARASGGNTYMKKASIPLGANLVWLSFAERKYYHAKIIFPREKMLELFAQKLDYELEVERYKYKHGIIAFALAPGGGVSVRVGGYATKEVAQFQTQEVEVSWEFFARTNHFDPATLSEAKYIQGFLDELPPRVHQQIKENKFPVDRWKNYGAQKFPWYMATKMDVTGYRQVCVNADSFFITKPYFDQIDRTVLLAAPAWFRWYFREDGKRYDGIVQFSKNDTGTSEQPEDDVEIFEFFKKYFQNSKLPAALVIEKEGDQFVSYLTNGSKKVEVPVVRSQILELKPNDNTWF